MCIFLQIDNKVDKKLCSIITTENFLGVAVLTLCHFLSIWIRVQAFSCEFFIFLHSQNLLQNFIQVFLKPPSCKKFLSLHFAKLSITNLHPQIGFVNSTQLTLVLKYTCIIGSREY